MVDHTIEELKGIVAEKLDMNIKREQIDPDAALLGDGLNLDSLAIVELITLTEEHFGIEYGEDDLNMESFANLRSLANVIVSYRDSAQNAFTMGAGI